ncbi:catecholate siderophore receptor Fiu [Herbaspirillum sp. RV1423]|uniref:catecholate siderophore receptor Fiu n=1 Tax=Herbaspirillum sp. RV1423 TaxID=1443993 RepID=UPI0004BA24AA|nr:catecholate siderophore receptor Fiu [Herbaspirillum sp. RV1423]
MTYIRNRKHAQPRFNPKVTAAIAGALLLPAVAHAQQAQLPSVEVTATQDNGYKAERASSAKYSQPLVDTPQTISVIKKEVLADQHAITLTDAVRNTPGVGTFYLGENGTTNTGDAIYMRGFDASSSIYVDNVRDLGSISRDMFNIEQVEILKGPAGTDNGRGSPTGSINLVTKQPELVNSFNSSVSYGSWSQKRATADWNKVIDDEKGMAFRLNLMKQDSGVPGRHEVNNERTGIAPSFVFGLNTPTRIYLDYLHVEQDNTPDGGVPTVGLPDYRTPDATRPFIRNAGRVSSSNFYGLSSDYDKVKSDMFTVRVDHDFSPNVKLQNTTRYARTTQDYLLTGFMGSAANLLTPNPANPATWTIARSNPTRKNQENEILTNQTNITTELETGALKHTLVGGVEVTQEKQHALSFTRVGNLPAANLYNPNPNDAIPAGYSLNATGYNDGKTDTASAYLFDTVKFNEKWSLNGGARVDHYRTTYFANAAGAITNLSTSGNLFNWKLAGIYKPTDYSSVYALYATSQQPPGGANFALSAAANSASNANYAPQKTKTAEVGTKWDLLNKKLALTAAVYRTEVENEVELDATSGLYFQTGKKRVQGLELGATGEITSNWSVSAGYSLMNTSVQSGAVVTQAGENSLSYTPRQAFTSWTTYKLPHGFTIGGGGRYVGKLYRGTDGPAASPTPTPQYVESYWVWDAMASYVVSKNLTLQLNMYNLFDKDYVAAINKSGYRYNPGLARSAVLTANIKF